MVVKMMSSVVVSTPCVADASAGAGAGLRRRWPPLRQLRGPLQQWSTCGPPLRSGLLGLRRGFVRGSEVTRKGFQGGPRADSETEERPGRAEGNGRAGGLEELDSQLQSLSSSDNLTSDTKPPSKEIVEKPPREAEKRVEWPVFGEGFALYISVGLVLLTIINNLIFNYFFRPEPRAPQQMPSNGPRQERYKLRSYNDPKYLERMAPPPAADDGPVS